MTYIDLLDVSKLAYPERLMTAALQGLVNRSAPRLFLDYGIYDDPAARRTNEVFLDDAIWYSKFRDQLGAQDRKNACYYTDTYGFRFSEVEDLNALVCKYAPELTGAVVYDPEEPDSINIALALAGLHGYLVIHPDRRDWAEEQFGLKVREDLRGRWTERVDLYAWAFQNLFPHCKPGQIAWVEPGWQRPEFVDYVVQNSIFPCSLDTKGASQLSAFGQKLLLLLVGGPRPLRNWLFETGLDGFIRRAGLALMGLGSPEVRLANQIMDAVEARPYPTIFGWHTCRDDEFSFMMHLSAHGLRLVPSHIAGNFSFHSRVTEEEPFEPQHTGTPEPLESGKVYLTFTLSDGDQLMMMSTAQLGNWGSPERGETPFNWEVQPLLVELAPALLQRFYRTRTPNDCLIAGPSGAGYVIPPLVPDLPRYLAETARICQQAGLRIFTSYIADPPQRVLEEHGRIPGNWLGFLAGYAHFGVIPTCRAGDTIFAANAWPHVGQIHDSSEQVLEAVREALEQEESRPRFIAIHLFAYRTTYQDVAAFVKTLDPLKVNVVRADQFLQALDQFLPTFP